MMSVSLSRCSGASRNRFRTLRDLETRKCKGYMVSGLYGKERVVVLHCC